MKDIRAHRVAVETAADGSRKNRVIGDIGRHQPEIDDGVQRPGEEYAREPRVDRGPQSERDRQDHENDFDRGADRGPAPQIGSRDIGEHRKRNRLAGIVPLPGRQVDRHQRDPYPGADHDEDYADIVKGIGDHRRIEGVEDGGEAQGDRNHRRHRPDGDEQEARPGPAAADQRPFQRRFGDRIAKTHRDERREDVAHRRAVRGDRAVIKFGTEIPDVQRAADEHLPGAEQQGEAEDREGQPEMGENQPLAIQHRSASAGQRSC